jgi:signal transduction histidine kinase
VRAQSPFRWRLAAAIAILGTLGLAAAGSLTCLLELRRTDARIADSLGRSVAELHNYATAHATSSLERIITGAVAQSVNASYECTLGAVPPSAWTHAGSAQMCRRVLADPELVVALADSTSGAVRVHHLDTDTGGYAYVGVGVRSAAQSDAQGVYAVVVDRAAQRAEVYHSYLWGFLPLALITVLVTAAGGWVAAGLILRPLSILAASTQRVARGADGAPDIGRRVVADGPPEVVALARAMNAMLDSLQAAWESQRRFLDDAGHELRTPLTVISGHLEILDVNDPADVAAARDLALDEIDRMRRLTDSLVALAQVERAGRANLSLTHLAPWFDEVVDKARALGARQWRVEARAEAWALVDQHLLTGALLELAANAVKHSPEGSRIAFGLAQEGAWARVWVADAGSGVDPADRERIFRRFERGRRDANRSQGAGLGLAIVAKILQAHGGVVYHEEAPGGGSVFTLALPAVEPPAMDAPTLEPATLEPATLEPSAPARPTLKPPTLGQAGADAEPAQTGES